MYVFSLKGFYFHLRPKPSVKSHYCMYLIRDFCYPVYSAIRQSSDPDGNFLLIQVLCIFINFYWFITNPLASGKFKSSDF